MLIHQPHASALDNDLHYRGRQKCNTVHTEGHISNSIPDSYTKPKRLETLGIVWSALDFKFNFRFAVDGECVNMACCPFAVEGECVNMACCPGRGTGATAYLLRGNIVKA